MPTCDAETSSHWDVLPIPTGSVRLQGEDKEKVDNAMHLVGMDSYAEKTMDKMSDGECQRIMIARALAQDTPVILLDEPTAFLDLPNRYELCLLLRKADAKGRKVYPVFHTRPGHRSLTLRHNHAD
ncbi:ATP-binding cassette domain-containing protein [Bacteroides thetaiotaomicron]|nr:ATP-binding cassette domain-containing protein [Bacteroides thetaiotaomicron]